MDIKQTIQTTNGNILHCVSFGFLGPLGFIPFQNRPNIRSALRPHSAITETRFSITVGLGDSETLSRFKFLLESLKRSAYSTAISRFMHCRFRATNYEKTELELSFHAGIPMYLMTELLDLIGILFQRSYSERFDVSNEKERAREYTYVTDYIYSSSLQTMEENHSAPYFSNIKEIAINTRRHNKSSYNFLDDRQIFNNRREPPRDRERTRELEAYATKLESYPFSSLLFTTFDNWLVKGEMLPTEGGIERLQYEASQSVNFISEQLGNLSNTRRL